MGSTLRVSAIIVRRSRDNIIGNKLPKNEEFNERFFPL